MLLGMLFWRWPMSESALDAAGAVDPPEVGGIGPQEAGVAAHEEQAWLPLSRLA